MIAAKPADAVDFCFLTGDTDFARPVTDMALCDADPRLAKHSSPRQVAGGPLAENILKCQLKPLNSADYAPVLFSSAQWVRPQATFPDGVCDWSEKGVGQRRAASPLTFADGPGGKRLPPPPVSAKRHILGLNSARLYGLPAAAVRYTDGGLPDYATAPELHAGGSMDTVLRGVGYPEPVVPAAPMPEDRFAKLKRWTDSIGMGRSNTRNGWMRTRV